MLARDDSARCRRCRPRPDHRDRRRGELDVGLRRYLHRGDDDSWPLVTPPLAESTVDADGPDVLARYAIRDEKPTFGARPRATETWGFNGSYLGPTCARPRRARAGPGAQPVARGRRQPTGTACTCPPPWTADRTSDQPGATGHREWTISQPAATLWYHPHPHGATGATCHRGLAGMFILDDGERGAAGCPAPTASTTSRVIVQDTQLNDAAPDLDSLLTRCFARSQPRLLGDHILVNGTHVPYSGGRHESVRLRLLNASTARIYTFGFDDSPPFAWIASDAGCSNSPCRFDRIHLSPGNAPRSSFAMSPGDQPCCAARARGGPRLPDGPVLRRRRHLRRPRTAGRRLVRPSRRAAGMPGRRSFPTARTPSCNVDSTSHSAINGERMDMSRIDTTVTRAPPNLGRAQHRRDGTQLSRPRCAVPGARLRPPHPS